MKGIVITTSQYTKDFLKPLLESIKDVKYTVLIVSNGGYDPKEVFLKHVSQHETILVINDWNGWEMGGIQQGKEHFDEFVHIMDSTLIKDISMFDKLFEIKGNVVLTKGNFHYMGKFVSELLPNSPRMNSKDIAIFHETTWLPQPYIEFIPDLPVHTNNFTTIYGQKRMVLENEYMIKYKGTWVRSAEHP